MIERNLQQAGFADRAGQDAHVHFGLPEFIEDGAGEHFLRLQGDGRIPLPDVFEQAGSQRRGNGGNEGDLEGSGERLLLRAGHLGQLVYIEKNHFRPVDDLAADGRRGYRMRVPVEDAHVQFLLHLLDHQAQGGLGKAAGLGCLSEVPVVVDGDDIAELLKRHVSLLD